MKTQTKTILEIIKYLALIGAIGFSIECGSQIISLMVSFVKPEVASKFYNVSPKLYELRNFDHRFFLVCYGIDHLVLGNESLYLVLYF